MHSILVVRHGYLVLERYYGGYTRNVAHAVQSVTKSVTSALIGIALDTGALASLDQPVVAFFPEYVTPALDPRKREITIRHLLTMTSGLQWEEADPTTRTGAVQRWRESSNQVKYVLELPLAQPPGTAFNYNSAGSHLLSAILTKATGMRTLEFANRQLFDPLGIEVLWAMDQQGINYGGFGLLMQPVDMAKFGYLYLQRGFWDGKQLVPEAWVKESTRAQLPDGLLTGEATYGYHWWVLEQSRPPAFRATGLGGQYLCVMPDLD